MTFRSYIATIVLAYALLGVSLLVAKWLGMWPALASIVVASVVWTVAQHQYHAQRRAEARRRAEEELWAFHVDREGGEPPWHTNYNTGLPCTCDNKGGDR